MERTIYREIGLSRGLAGAAAIVALALLAGLIAVVVIEEGGHIVTGMTNQIVWGTPHIFAIFLIVAASGALNVASIASVFGRSAYKPLSRLSGLLAIALLVGGLAVLVLDLGRADRLIVAMTTYNFSSIFAWNIFLYTGFIVVTALYLFVQMSRGGARRYVPAAGLLAFLWRLALTTGTGSIFGWLVARPAYDAAIMAPLFIAMSFSFGLAVFIIVLVTLSRLGNRPLGLGLVTRLARLLALFVAAVLYFTAVQHLTNLYAQEHAGIEAFILRTGGLYTWLFWGGQVILGGLLPMAMIFGSKNLGIGDAVLASLFVIAGGFAQLYVIIIGGQAYPLEIFPGFVTSSSFQDGVVAAYTPSWSEIALGLGGVGIAAALTLLGVKVLRILPTNLGDANLAAQARVQSA
ncbi:MAG: molybdopterin oxidoreductase [Alphaproteobacteria bacterium]|nr:MAG: molybdopterin oxidoreductase [Alphaproteobacteria bacterium]